MAMCSLVGMLKGPPRRAAGSITAALKETKPGNAEPESLVDDATLEQVRRIFKPYREAKLKRFEEEHRAYKRKIWLITVAAYGSVGYILTCAVRAAKN